MDIIRLEDNFHREITRFRISVTSKCNLNCFYCHHEGNNTDHQNELTINQIKQIASIATKYKIEEIKITGGEPLLHPHIVEIVQIFSSIPSVQETSITTNGYFLEKLAVPLKAAGLTRLNIGCDSINKSSVKSIKAIENGLHIAKKVGFEPIKLNMVLLKGINDTEISEMIAFAQKESFILQIIELINSNLNGFYEKYHVSLDQVERILSKQAVKIINRKVQDRKQYQLPGGNIVELVQPVDNSHFCAQCHTMRITNDYQFQPCINRNDNLVPIGDNIEASLARAMRNRQPFNE